MYNFDLLIVLKLKYIINIMYGKEVGGGVVRMLVEPL